MYTHRSLQKQYAFHLVMLKPALQLLAYLLIKRVHCDSRSDGSDGRGGMGRHCHCTTDCHSTQQQMTALTCHCNGPTKEIETNIYL